MAKKKKTNTKKNKEGKMNYTKKGMGLESNYSIGIMKIVKCIIAVFIILGGAYLLSVYLTDKNKREALAPAEATIQYNTILVGESYRQKEEDYFVLYYDEEDIATYSSAISTYTDKKNSLPIYRSYTNEALNSKFVKEEATKPESDRPSDLRVKKDVLIRFQNHKITEYIEGSEAIISYLEEQEA